jgi:2-polyprenyl-3-methyl-5-hydroxy-6-metoxy-1,4-benzoquinol methylase
MVQSRILHQMDLVKDLDVIADYETRRADALARIAKRSDIRPSMVVRYGHMVELVGSFFGGTNARLIDIGCNTGVLSRYLAKTGLDVTGVDVNPKHIKRAEGNIGKSLVGSLRYRLQDATVLSDPGNSFHLANSTEVLEHVPDYRSVLLEKMRVVKPGGRIFVSVPRENRCPDPGHINFFTRETGTEMINVDGLVESLGAKAEWHDDERLPQYLIFSFDNPEETGLRVSGEYGKKREWVLERIAGRTDIRESLKVRYAHMVDVVGQHYSGTDAKLIDIGCNTGVFTRYLAKLGYDMLGVDVNRKHIGRARKTKGATPNLAYRVQDATALQDPDNKFDGANITEVLEHVEDYEAVLRQAMRVVKPNGRIYVSVPKNNMVPDPGHINVFTSAACEEVVKGLGANLEWHNDAKSPQYLIFSFVNT